MYVSRAARTLTLTWRSTTKGEAVRGGPLASTVTPTRAKGKVPGN